MGLAGQITPEIIASWPFPNYVDPVTRGPELYIVNSIWLFLATSAVLLRLYSRIWIRNWFGLDDAFVLVALILAFGITSCVVLGSYKYGWDRHIWDTPWALLEDSGRTLFAAKLLWTIASSSVRSSIMVLYYRLLDHSGLQRYRWVLHLNVAFMVIVVLQQLLTTVLACIPIKAMWAFPPIWNGRCIDVSTAMLSGACLNTISEFIVALLPVAAVFHLRMTKKQRWIVISMLSLGFFVTIVGAARTYFLWRAIASYDQSWWAMPHWVCSEVEIDTALIVSCIPVLRPLIGRLLSGGPAMARRPALDEFGRPKKGEHTRHRALLARRSKIDEKYSTPTTSPASTLLYKSIDLEGIANDGFGYTVSITTQVERRSSSRWRRCKIERKRPRTVSWPWDMLEPSSISRPRKLVSVSKRSDIVRRSSKADVDLESMPMTGIEVMTRRSVEVRASYHEDDDKNWNVRVLNTPVPQKDDLEMGIRGSSPGLTDPSVWDEEFPNQNITPHLPYSPKIVRPLNPQRPSSVASPQLPRLSISYLNSSYDRLHKGRLSRNDQRGNPVYGTGPSNVDPGPNNKPVLPLMLRPAASLRSNASRTRSPAIAPVNSSQWWESSPHPLRASSSSAGNTAGSETWQEALDLFKNSIWDEERRLSFSSSIAAMDGSRENLC